MSNHNETTPFAAQENNARPDRSGSIDGDSRELWIERLVQGELSAKQRQEVLLAAENWRDGWRTIALAFVENQLLGECLSSDNETAMELPCSSAGRLPALPPDSAPGLVPDLVPDLAPEFSSDTTSGTSSDPAAEIAAADKQRFGRPVPASWWAAAACLLALCGGFWFGNQFSTPGIDRSTIADIDPSTVPGDPIRDQSQPVTYRQTTLKIPTADSNETIDVPLWELPDLPDWGTPWDHSIPTDIQEAFYRQGFQVIPSTTYVRGQLEDNREFLFPLHEVTVKPLAQ